MYTLRHVQIEIFDTERFYGGGSQAHGFTEYTSDHSPSVKSCFSLRG